MAIYNSTKTGLEIDQAALSTSATTAVTTVDITGAIGYVYDLDISGITTASKNFTLPVGAVGDVITINITAGDPDYELIVKGVATVTINGGTAATEWSRLFITGESVTFRVTSLTNWQVIIDGRIPCVGRMFDDNNTSYTGGTNNTVVFDGSTNDYDLGDIIDYTNNAFSIRRNGLYIISFHAMIDSASISLTAYITGSGSLNILRVKQASNTVAGVSCSASQPYDLSYGAPIGMILRPSATKSTGTLTDRVPQLFIQEVL